jgi:phosphoribosylformimino-5-aminoimidazole carboxamide ribotide isomerase
MRLIPVIDLWNNQAVHAVKGERKHYRPVKSVLCNTSDPLSLARVFRDRLGSTEIYIADLNAIQDSNRTCHRNLLENLASREKMHILLDAGVSDAEEAQNWLDLGIYKAVIGAETLKSWNALKEIPSGIDPSRLVFSLDCRDGKILSRCPDLSFMSPVEALKHLEAYGWREVILLDLKRVGSSSGIHLTLATEARAVAPGLDLLIGGGISCLNELLELKSLGVSGVLAATALHKGIIGPHHISALNQKNTSP